MTRRPTLTQAQTLLLALALVAQGTFAAAAGQRGVSVPSLGPVTAPIVNTALPALPVAAPSLTLPGAQLPGVTAMPVKIPSAVPAAAAAQVPGAPAAQAAVGGGLGAIATGIAPQIQAIAKPDASIDSSVQSGRAIETLLQGGKASENSGVVASLGAVADGSAGAASSGLAPATPSSPSSKGDGPKAPQAPSVKPVDSAVSYQFRRMGLALVAKVFGAVYSLPQAGPKLTEAVLKKAAYKDAILSDIDDTLGKYNTILEPETVNAIVAVRKSGKTFAAITDRPDFARKGSSQLGAMDTFSSVPVDQREGLIVATNGGGKIYQYDNQGEPKLIYEEPNLPEAQREIVKAAAEVVKAQLAGLGSGLQTTDPKDASKPMEAENHGPYGFSMILKAGTPETTVKQIAHLMETEMRARGLTYEVEGRMAKDATLPPYITFSKLNKSLAVARIKALEKLDDARSIVIGDSMYAPKHAGKKSAMSAAAERWAERLSGRPLPLTGNATDRNMELSMPGAMALSVGGTADPRMSGAFVLDGKGAEATRRVLNAMASKKPGDESRGTKAAHFLLVLALMVAAGLAYYTMISAFSDVMSGNYTPGPQDPNVPQYNGPIPDLGQLFGGR